MSERSYYVYILTNAKNRVLYTGMTGDLARRIDAHRSGAVQGFTQKYDCTKLVYVEVYETAEQAILREKQIKGGSRAKKIALIEKDNPQWADISEQLV